MEIIKVILASLLSAMTLFIIAKIMGHKQIAQLDFFNYITGITIGSIAAELATMRENPVLPLSAMIVYGMVSVLLNIIMTKFPKTRKYINGTPTIIMSGGKIFRKNLKKTKLDLSEFMSLCRQAGYFDLDDIQVAIFEYNGRLTVLPNAANRPLTPADMSVNAKPDCIYTELIMDGKILGENLYRIKKDEAWLLSAIKLQGYDSARKVFLCLCDDSLNIKLYPMD